MVSGKSELDRDLSNYDGLQSVVSGKSELDRDLSNYDGLCVHQPNDAKRYDYHLVYTSFPLAFSYISINSH